MTHLELFQAVCEREFVAPKMFRIAEKQVWASILCRPSADLYHDFKTALAKHDVGPLDKIQP